jgi:hypothetical protein
MTSAVALLAHRFLMILAAFDLLGTNPDHQDIAASRLGEVGDASTVHSTSPSGEARSGSSNARCCAGRHDSHDACDSSSKDGRS